MSCIFMTNVMGYAEKYKKYRFMIRDFVRYSTDYHTFLEYFSDIYLNPTYFNISVLVSLIAMKYY